MKDEKRPLKTSSARGTYARQACNHCRRRKSKCDGQQPVCGPCRDSGRADECTWGRETAKKARTQQHFESLVNHIKALESRVKELEGELARARRSGSVSDATPSASGSSLSPHPSPITKYEPDDDDRLLDTGDGTDDEPRSSDHDSEIEQLIAPTRHLVLQGDHLELYGPTSAYRLAPETTDSNHSSGSGTPANSNGNGLHSDIPTFEWNRYLPPEARISRIEHDRLLDLLFRFCTSWCYRIIPSLFWRDMHRALTLPPSAPLPRSAHYSPMLHNAALALAATFSDDPVVHNIEFRRHFARRAKSYIEQDCLTPNVCLVSALSLLSTFHSSRGEQSLGYLYAGMAGRMTQALGLQIDCLPLVKSGRIKESDMFERNWAYWTTFCQDVLWSLYIGRDCALQHPAEGRQVPVPYVDSEHDHEPWIWPPSGLPSQKSNIASVFQATCSLLTVARRVMDFVNGLGTDFKHPNLQVVSELDIELNAWKDNLPPEVDLTAATRPSALPHRLSVHLMFWWLFILLHRPFYRRAKALGVGDIDHVKLCNRAAENMMLLLGIWHTNYGLRYVSTTHVQFTFSAGTVFVLSAIQAISGPRLGRVTLASSLSQVETCVEYLSIMGNSWETATCAKEILINFFDETLKPRLLLRGGDVHLVQFDESDKLDRTRTKIRGGSASTSSGSPRSDRPPREDSPSSPTSASATFGIQPVSLSPTMPDLRYFPAPISQQVHNLGWPTATALDTSRLKPGGGMSYPLPVTLSGSAGPTSRVSGAGAYTQAAGNGGDMDLDIGYAEMSPSPGGGVSVSMSGSMPPPVSQHPSSHQGNTVSVDMMSFGVPEVGVGYQFDPRAHPQIAFEFSDEELAIMDQIVRQQVSAGGGGTVMMDFPAYGGVSSAV